MELLQVLRGLGQDGHLGGLGAVRQTRDLVPQRQEARAQVVAPLAFQEIVSLAFVRVLAVRGLGARQLGGGLRRRALMGGRRGGAAGWRRRRRGGRGRAEVGGLGPGSGRRRLRLSAVRVRRDVAGPRLVVKRVLRLGRETWDFVSNLLPRRLGSGGEHVRRGGGVVVLLLMDGDVETLRAGVVGICSHRYGHRFAGGDQSTGFTLLLLLGVHRHHVNLLLVFILFVFVI